MLRGRPTLHPAGIGTSELLDLPPIAGYEASRPLGARTSAAVALTNAVVKPVPEYV
jgi:hypothetical protein